MKTKLQQKSFFYFSLVLGGILFSYILLRVFRVAPIHDELATLFHYIDYGTFWGKGATLDANNHLLNSFFGKVAYSIFGDHIWAIRLPNAFSFLVFFFGCYKIAGLLRSSFLNYALLIGATCIPYVLDYFAYCRGYGMSMAFLIMACYFFIITIKGKLVDWKIITGMMLFLLLAIYSNLNLVIPSGVILAYIGLFLLLKTLKKNKYKSFILYCVGGIVFIFLLLPAIKFAFDLKEAGALYYGNQDGLWETTGATLSLMIFYSKAIFIKWILIAFFITFIGAFLWKWKKKGNTVFLQPFTLWITLLIVNLIAVVMMVVVMDTNYPEDRVGMHLIFFFLFSFLFFLDDFPKIRWLGILVLLLPILGWQSFNLNSSVFSPDDRMAKSDYDFLINKVKDNPSFMIYGTQALTYAYRVRKNNPTDFVVPNVSFARFPQHDAVISIKTKKEYDLKAGEIPPSLILRDSINDFSNYKQLRYNPTTWFLLLKKKDMPTWQTVHKVESRNKVSLAMYYNLSDSLWKSIENKWGKYEIECTVHTPVLRKETLVLVVDKTFTDGRKEYSKFVLNWASGKHRKYTFRRAVLFQPKKMKNLAIYLYNPNKLKFELIDYSVELKKGN